MTESPRKADLNIFELRDGLTDSGNEQGVPDTQTPAMIHMRRCFTI